MAFIDIEDPVKREQTVQDYIKTIQEIRQRKENQKVHGIQERQNIERVFQPVVQATEKSASQITSEIKNLKEKPEKQKPISATLNYYLNDFNKLELDRYYGIYEKDGIYMMGEKEIKVDESNNIHVDDIVIKGTPGLWELIMMNKPEAYNDDDAQQYQELLERTNAIKRPHKINTSDRPTTTLKYKFLTGNGEEEEEAEEGGKRKRRKEQEGKGVHFLPGDINGLIEQLHLLLAEFRAGNKSTNTQIVAILDELLRRNYLDQDEYNGVCRTLLWNFWNL